MPSKRQITQDQRGRPPKLTREMILGAAIELGLGEFSMASLAERLGTGLSAIYRLVNTREQIVQEAAKMLATQFEPPRDSGQDWWDYLIAHGAFLFDVLTENRLRAVHFLEGGLGPRVQLESAEPVLGALLLRGFSPEEAFTTVQGVVHIVGGAALTRIHLDALREQGRDHATETYRFLRSQESGHLPNMRTLADQFADEARHTDWRTPLETYLRGIAQQRGETIP